MRGLPTQRIMLFGTLFVTAACTPVRVNTSIQNPYPIAQAVSVRIGQGTDAREIALGTAPPNASLSSTFTVKATKDIVVTAQANGLESWTSAPTTIGKSPNPHQVNETIALAAQLPDRAKGVQTVVDQFTRLGFDY